VLGVPQQLARGWVADTWGRIVGRTWPSSTKPVRAHRGSTPHFARGLNLTGERLVMASRKLQVGAGVNGGTNTRCEFEWNPW
jgi:hypothetical protein